MTPLELVDALLDNEEEYGLDIEEYEMILSIKSQLLERGITKRQLNLLWAMYNDAQAAINGWIPREIDPFYQD